jgi:hypothetical protein
MTLLKHWRTALTPSDVGDPLCLEPAAAFVNRSFSEPELRADNQGSGFAWSIRAMFGACVACPQGSSVARSGDA